MSILLGNLHAAHKNTFPLVYVIKLTTWRTKRSYIQHTMEKGISRVLMKVIRESEQYLPISNRVFFILFISITLDSCDYPFRQPELASVKNHIAYIRSRNSN